MVVHCLAKGVSPRHDDGPLVVRERQHHRSNAGVRDDCPRAPYVLEDAIEREVVELGGAVAPDRREPVLDDDVLAHVELGDRPQEPVERRLMGSDGDEDHRRLKTVPA